MKAIISFPEKSRSRWLAAAGLLMIASTYQISLAYEQYTDPDGGCVTCHGDFRGNTSTKGTIFPNNKNHDMHQDSASELSGSELKRSHEVTVPCG